jgi:hypothetical protein
MDFINKALRVFVEDGKLRARQILVRSTKQASPLKAA